MTRRLRRAAVAVCLLVGLTLALALVWYLMSRVLSSARAIRSYEVSPTAAESAAGSALKVATFNIAHGRGGAFGASNWQDRSRDDLIEHLRAIGSQLRRSDADVVVLNEVDFSASWSFHVNQAEFLARDAGYRFVAEQRNLDFAVPFYSFRFGNAILSRFPLSDVEFVDLPALSRWEDLAAGNHDALFAVAETTLGPVGIAALHLEYRSEAVRVQAVEAMLARLDNSYDPVVLAGDLNSSPKGYPGSQRSEAGHNAVDLLLGRGFLPGKTTPTFPSERPEFTIDWVLSRGGLGEIRAETIQADLSDHLMVVATLDPG